MDIKVDNAAIEEIVNLQIRSAVAEVLKSKADYLIQRLIDDALNRQAGYG